jgi:hypothetical protein
MHCAVVSAVTEVTYDTERNPDCVLRSLNNVLQGNVAGSQGAEVLDLTMPEDLPARPGGAAGVVEQLDDDGLVSQGAAMEAAVVPCSTTSGGVRLHR